MKRFPIFGSFPAFDETKRRRYPTKYQRENERISFRKTTETHQSLFNQGKRAFELIPTASKEDNTESDNKSKENDIVSLLRN